MKLAWNNYLKDSIVTATNEDSQYPVSNLYHKFLERVFKPNGLTTTITVTFPEDRDVSCIGTGFTNITNIETQAFKLVQGSTDSIVLTQGAVDKIKLTLPQGFIYELQNSTGTILRSGAIETEEDINMIYFDPIVCRKAVFYIDSGSADTYLGGLIITDPLEIKALSPDPQYNTLLRDTVTQTDGGQVIGAKITDLKEWVTTAYELDIAKKKQIIEMIKSLGGLYPLYADIYEESHEIEDPMYAIMTEAGAFQRITANGDYVMPITLKEAR